MSILDPAAQRLLADRVARAFYERAVPVPERTVMDEATRRYQTVTRALVERVVLACSATGNPRDPDDFAQGICKTWTKADLYGVRHPTVLHAVMVALVLDLKDTTAAEYIELAGILEYRLPIMARETAMRLYQGARGMLGRLSTEWAQQGKYTSWTAMDTDIDRLFRIEGARMLSAAWQRDIPVEAVRGIDLSRITGSASMPDVVASLDEIPVSSEDVACGSGPFHGDEE